MATIVDVLIDDVTWACATRSRQREWRLTLDELLAEGRVDGTSATALRLFVTIEATLIRATFLDQAGHYVGGAELPRAVIGPIFREYLSLLQGIAQLGTTGYSPQVEALDIARKLLHNDAADLIVRHSQRAVPTHRTARLLFTLYVILTHDTGKLYGPT
jgi:uncharacterized protein (UPF0262 family)